VGSSRRPLLAISREGPVQGADLTLTGNGPALRDRLVMAGMSRTTVACQRYRRSAATRVSAWKTLSAQAHKLLNAYEENLRSCPRARLTTRNTLVVASIGQVILPVRPDRVETQAFKRRPKPHKLLTKPGRVFRERLRRQQQRHASAFALGRDRESKAWIDVRTTGVVNTAKPVERTRFSATREHALQVRSQDRRHGLPQGVWRVLRINRRIHDASSRSRDDGHE
jgi:hypothetical protein